jgi:hypothetical protein
MIFIIFVASLVHLIFHNDRITLIAVCVASALLLAYEKWPRI